MMVGGKEGVFNAFLSFYNFLFVSSCLFMFVDMESVINICKNLVLVAISIWLVKFGWGLLERGLDKLNKDLDNKKSGKKKIKP